MSIEDTMKDIRKSLENLDVEENTDTLETIKEEISEGVTSEVGILEEGTSQASNPEGETSEIEGENEANAFTQDFERPVALLYFDFKIKLSYLFDFLLYHGYKGVMGVVNVLLFVIPTIYVIYSYVNDDSRYRVAAILMAILFGTNPLMIFRKAATQIKLNPTFKQPFHYEISETGVLVEQDGLCALTKWDEIFKIKETRVNILLYVKQRGAFVFPKVELGEKENEAKRLIGKYANCAPKKFKEMN